MAASKPPPRYRTKSLRAPAKIVRPPKSLTKAAHLRIRKTHPNSIRIVVADVLALDRKLLVSLLGTQPDFEVVGEASSTEQASSMCRDLKPAIALIAINMGSHVGRTPIADIHAAAPDVPILAIAQRGEGECVVLNLSRPGRTSLLAADGVNSPVCNTGADCLQIAVAEGSLGTIRRSAEPDVFFHAVRTISLGNAWYDAGTATAIMRAMAPRQGADSHPLSPRELEVTGMISTGSSNKEISTALGIGVPTVKKHVGHILEKLGVQDRLQLGLYAARNPMMLQPNGRRR